MRDLGPPGLEEGRSQSPNCEEHPESQELREAEMGQVAFPPHLKDS